MVINETVYFYEGASAEAIAALADVFRYGREEGVLRGGLSDDALASCILNLMHGVGHSKGDAVQRLSLEELVDLFCHGIMKS